MMAALFFLLFLMVLFVMMGRRNVAIFLFLINLGLSIAMTMHHVTETLDINL